MKRIFIGSSSEAKGQAVMVAEALRSIPGVEPILWSEYFTVGDITFIGIEKLASMLHGAILLATPDDHSVIRGNDVLTPRANVLFEYGYLTAALGRSRVALCRYDSVVLPSDFQGLTYIGMGAFASDARISSECTTKLIKWASTLPSSVLGQGATKLNHGLSGHWRYEVVYQMWRKMLVRENEFVVIHADLLLDISPDGTAADGCMYGYLKAEMGGSFAEFRITNKVQELKCTPTGGLVIKMETYSRQLMGAIQGTPPQTDGYEQVLKAAHTFQVSVEPDAHAPRMLIGSFDNHWGGSNISKGSIKMWR